MIRKVQGVEAQPIPAIPIPLDTAQTVAASERHKLLDRQRRANLKLQLQQLALAIQPPDDSTGGISDVLSRSRPVLTSHVEIVTAACSEIHRLNLEKQALRQSLELVAKNGARPQEDEPESTPDSISSSVQENECIYCTQCYRPSSADCQHSAAASASDPSLTPACDPQNICRSFLFAASGVCALRLGPDDTILDCNELAALTVGFESSCIIGTRCDQAPLFCKFYHLPKEFESGGSGNEASMDISPPAALRELSTSTSITNSSAASSITESEILSLFANSTLAEAPVLAEQDLRPLVSCSSPIESRPHSSAATQSRNSNSESNIVSATIHPSDSMSSLLQLPPASPNDALNQSPSHYLASIFFDPNQTPIASFTNHDPIIFNPFASAAFSNSPNLAAASSNAMASSLLGLSPNPQTAFTPSNQLMNFAQDSEPTAAVPAKSNEDANAMMVDTPPQPSSTSSISPAAASSSSPCILQGGGGSLYASLLGLIRASPSSTLVPRLMCRQMTSWGEIMEAVMVVSIDQTASTTAETMDTSVMNSPPLILLSTPDSRRLLTIVNSTNNND